MLKCTCRHPLQEACLTCYSMGLTQLQAQMGPGQTHQSHTAPQYGASFANTTQAFTHLASAHMQPMQVMQPVQLTATHANQGFSLAVPQAIPARSPPLPTTLASMTSSI